MNDDIFCKFVKIKDMEYECSKCGNTISIEDNIDEPPLLPCSIILTEFSSDNIRNIMTNYKSEEDLCSSDMIESRHNICYGCEFFQDSSCSKCGCALTRERNYLNKLALKDQSCPISKW